jgi:hypothetical protein
MPLEEGRTWKPESVIPISELIARLGHKCCLMILVHSLRFLLLLKNAALHELQSGQGVSPSAVSHSMRTLEEEVGVRLLARTTRSVAFTESGEHLIGRLRPALTEVGETLEELSGRRDKAAGRVRLLARCLRPS